VASVVSCAWGRLPAWEGRAVPLVVRVREPRVVRLELCLLRKPPSAAQRDKPSVLAHASTYPSTRTTVASVASSALRGTPASTAVARAAARKYAPRTHYCFPAKDAKVTTTAARTSPTQKVAKSVQATDIAVMRTASNAGRRVARGRQTRGAHEMSSVALGVTM
jgi:hypothetical protein